MGSHKCYWQSILHRDIFFFQQSARDTTLILAPCCHTAVAGWWVQWSLDFVWGCGFEVGSPSGAVYLTWSSSPGGAAVGGWPGWRCGWAGWGLKWGQGGQRGGQLELQPELLRHHSEERLQWGCQWSLYPRFPQQLWCPRRTAAGKCCCEDCCGGRGSHRCQQPPRSLARWM